MAPSPLRYLQSRHTALVRTAWSAADTIVAFQRGLPGDWLEAERRGVRIDPVGGADANRFELWIGRARGIAIPVTTADVRQGNPGAEVWCLSQLSAFSLVGLVMWTVVATLVALAALINAIRTGTAWSAPWGAMVLYAPPLIALLIGRARLAASHRRIVRFVALAVNGQPVAAMGGSA